MQKLKQSKMLETRRKRRIKNNAIEHDINKDSLMDQKLHKQELTEDYGMKCCMIRNNATEVIEHQEHNTNNSKQFKKNSSHCEGIDNQERDEIHSEVMEHSGQCASHGEEIDYPDKTQSISKEIEQTVPSHNLYEGVECLEQNPDYSEGIKHPNEYDNDRVEHPDQNQNLKEDQEQSLNSEEMNNPMFTRSERSKTWTRSKFNIEKMHLDQCGSEQTKHKNKIDYIKEELTNHEASRNQQRTEDDLSNSTLHTSGNNKDNLQDEPMGRKLRVTQAVQYYGYIDDPDNSDSGSDMRDSDDDPEFNAGESDNDTGSGDDETGSASGSAASDDNSEDTSKINKPFDCPHCPRRFKINSLLVKHLRVHIKAESISCPQCYKVLESDESLAIHLIGHRTTQKVGPYICPHCSKEIENRYSWQRHVFYHENGGFQYVYVQTCHPCKMGFRSDRKFRQHRYKYHRDEIKKERNEYKQLEANKTYLCPYCNKEVRKKGWKAHLNSHIEGRERNYVCSNCGKAFFDKHGLAKHELLHTDRDRAFACDYCKRSFLRKIHLDVHKVHCLNMLKIRSSSESNRHECPTCKRGYGSEKKLKLHMQVHTERKRNYLCSVCSKGFFHKYSRNRHELFNHKIIPTVEKESCKCKICGKCFVSQKYLTKHKLVHAKTRCNVCRRKIISSELKIHKAIHTLGHLGNYNTCTECKTDFDSVDALKEHQLIHFKEQTDKFQNGETSKNNSNMTENNTSREKHPFYCSICQKTFTQKHSLTRHMKLHPLDRKMFTDFDSVDALKEHQIVHCKEGTDKLNFLEKNSFVCTQCNSNFESQEDLMEHNAMHDKSKTYKVKKKTDKTSRVCSQCNKHFKSKSALNRHELNHKKVTQKINGITAKSDKVFQNGETSENNSKMTKSNTSKEKHPFYCSICQKTFSKKGNLTRHMKLHPVGREMFTDFDSVDALKVHQLVHCKEQTDKLNSLEKNPFVCTQCNSNFESQEDLMEHNAIHDKSKTSCRVKKKTGKTSLGCSQCNKHFKSKSALNCHELNHKKVNQKRNCITAKSKKDFQNGETSKNNSNMTKNNTSWEKHPFYCSICQKTFSSKGNLTRHMKLHPVGREMFTDFDSVDALQVHQLVHCKEQTDKLNSLEKKTFVCTQCNSNFESQEDLMEHNAICDKSKTSCRVKKKIDKTSLGCSQCNKYFKSKSALNRHELNHKKLTQKMNGITAKSDKVFQNGETSKNNSNMTKNNTSREKHPFYCSICLKTFSQKINLTRHMKLHSGGRKMITCHISTCQKTFRQSWQLTKHMKLHSGERKMFACQICDNFFSTKNNLEAHLRSHTDIEEAYLCSECLNIFASREILKEHIEAVHAKEKLYPCPLCPMKFAYKNTMQKHFLSHRGENVLSCPHCPKYYESQEDMNWHIIRSHQDIVHKFSYKDEFYYNLRILEEDPNNIDKKEPESTTNVKSKMEKINQNTPKMRKKRFKQILDKQETGLLKNQNPTESEGLRNISMDKENGLQECSIMLKYQYTYSGINDKPLTLWL